MAGKKKKSLANKLAKMSDEERARYMQHRADMEEEARRRKEQLISTFLKKKIKKEEAFARLNVAKINLNWHQILRKTKCKEMKENIEHMKGWIERLINFKNRTISKLMEELEEAEEQYLNNFQSHATHIDNIIERQNQYIDKLQKQYEEDIESFLETTTNENNIILKTSESDEEHLKTILFAQEAEAKKTRRKNFENYSLKLYEDQFEFETKLKNLRKSREGVSGAIWRQIATVVRVYVQQTDSRRMHLAELKRLDAESAAEIARNGDRIKLEEGLIKTLKKEHECLLSDRELKIKNLEAEVDTLSKNLLKIRKNLQKELHDDEKKLKLLVDTSYRTIQNLDKLARKGDQIRNLSNTCKKFETPKEKLAKWLPICDVASTYDGEVPDNIEDSGMKDKIKIIADHLKDAANIQKYSRATPTPTKSKPRPKTAVCEPDTPTPESRKITTVKNVRLQAKGSQDQPFSPSPPSSSSSGTPTKSVGIVERCVESLKDLENFWVMFNKVEVDCLEVKEEKKVLERENKQLRGMIRAVLEAASLSQSIPNSKVSTRLPSRRGARSAPFRRVVFN